MAAFCECCGAQITLKAEPCPACGAPQHGMLLTDLPPGQAGVKVDEEQETRASAEDSLGNGD